MFSKLEEVGLRAAFRTSRAIESYLDRRVRDRLLAASAAVTPAASAPSPEALKLRAARLFWPLDLNQDFALIASSPLDAIIVNYGMKLIADHIVPKVVCEAPDVRAALDAKRMRIISTADFARDKVPVVVMPSGVNEQSTIDRLYRLWRETGHIFNIYDAFNESDVCKEEQVRRYRGVDLYLFPTVLWPTLYSNWGFINYLVSEVVRDRPLDVLDMFAGSGVIGFCLKDETPIRSVSFCDANFWAIRAIRETGRRGPQVAGEAWLSEGLRGIPETAQFDLIVGNPPHVDQSLSGPSSMPGSDPGWEAHRQFFAEAHRYLRPGGRIIFIEARLSGSYEQFYKHLSGSYPMYRVVEHRSFSNYACYAVLIELA